MSNCVKNKLSVITTNICNVIDRVRKDVDGQRDAWEFGLDMYTLIYLNYTIKKDLLYSTGNSAPYSVIT